MVFSFRAEEEKKMQRQNLNTKEYFLLCCSTDERSLKKVAPTDLSISDGGAPSRAGRSSQFVRTKRSEAVLI